MEVFARDEIVSLKWHVSFLSFLGSCSSDPVLTASFDSKPYRTAVFTPHTGFSDPPEGTPFRQSIELGALVFYD